MLTIKNQIQLHKAVILYCVTTLALAIVGFIYNKNDLEQAFLAETITSTQQLFGSMPLPAEQEAMIRAVIKEIGIERTVLIRKMNSQALAQFGYHNAFAYNPMIYNLLPISSVSFMFISEGFFEDLSPAEQRFLIGHEAAHIKAAHLQYLPSMMLLLIIVFAAIGIYLLNCLNIPIVHYIKNTTARFFAKKGALYLLLICGYLTCRGIVYTHRRHIEKEADYMALQTLTCYDGLSQLLERWQKEFKFPEHNPYFGLLADHPSCAERKAYCLELQNQQNRKDLA